MTTKWRKRCCNVASIQSQTGVLRFVVLTGLPFPMNVRPFCDARWTKKPITQSFADAMLISTCSRLSLCHLYDLYQLLKGACFLGMSLLPTGTSHLFLCELFQICPRNEMLQKSTHRAGYQRFASHEICAFDRLPMKLLSKKPPAQFCDGINTERQMPNLCNRFLQRLGRLQHGLKTSAHLP